MEQDKISTRYIQANLSTSPYTWTIPRLDKGYVKYVRHMGDDNSPVEDARMSTGTLTGVDVVKDDKLREYLWKNNHTSPFEGCSLTVELKIPLFVLHQLDRHRTLDIEAIETYDEFRKFTSRNEFSGRYAEFSDQFYVPSYDRIGGQDFLNKQGTSGTLPEFVAVNVGTGIDQHNKQSYEGYQAALAMGVSKELARLLLPNTIYTKIRITSNLLNWFKFLRLRLEAHAQWEVRTYAEGIEQIIVNLWPKCHFLFDKYTKVKQ